MPVTPRAGGLCRSISSARSIYPARNGKIPGDRWTNWRPTAGQSWHSFNATTNFSDSAAPEKKMVGKKWIRTDIGDYDSPI